MNADIQKCLTDIFDQLSKLNDLLTKQPGFNFDSDEFNVLVDKAVEARLTNLLNAHITSNEFSPVLLQKLDDYLDSESFSNKIDDHLQHVNFENLADKQIDEKIDTIDFDDLASEQIAEAIKTNRRFDSNIDDWVKDALNENLSEEIEDKIEESLRELLRERITSLPSNTVVQIFELIFK